MSEREPFTTIRYIDKKWNLVEKPEDAYAYVKRVFKGVELISHEVLILKRGSFAATSEKTVGSARRSTLAGFLPVAAESIRAESTSLGVQRVVWKTQGDAKVCPICDELEGTVYDADDPDKPLPIDDTHPNCRCDYEDVLTGAVVDF